MGERHGVPLRVRRGAVRRRLRAQHAVQLAGVSAAEATAERAVDAARRWTGIKDSGAVSASELLSYQMAAKEAKARIKINTLLEESGWRFFDSVQGKANIVLEPRVRLTKAAVDALGENFEESANGFIDFLLQDENGFPLVVLEAKSDVKASVDALIDTRFAGSPK